MPFRDVWPPVDGAWRVGVMEAEDACKNRLDKWQDRPRSTDETDAALVALVHVGVEVMQVWQQAIVDPVERAHSKGMAAQVHPVFARFADSARQVDGRAAIGF